MRNTPRSARQRRRSGRVVTTAAASVAASPDWRPRSLYLALALAGLTAAAFAVHFAGQHPHRLWLDEASTDWVTRESWVALLGQAGTDGTPPLYFLIVKACTQLFGNSELALRLPSLLAETVLIPALYFLGRRIGGVRAGLLAAVLAAVSPLVHYYSGEARNYAVLHLETAALAVAWYRAADAPGRWDRWIALSLVAALELWTHIYAAFLLPSVPIATMLLAAREHRRTAVVRSSLAILAAFGVCSVWLRMTFVASQAGVGDWIVPLWNELPPSMAVVRSLSLFGFGTAYPAYLWLPTDAWIIGEWSLALTIVMLLASFWGADRERPRRVVAAAMTMLLLPLAAAWVYSLVAEPIYLPGRYDTIVLPLFLAVFAVGLDRVWRWRSLAGLVTLAVVLLLAGETVVRALDPATALTSPDVAAGETLARLAKPGDLVVATALRRPITWYYATRSGFQGTITTFPSQVNAHPGWESASRMLADPSELQRDGEAVVRELTEAARAGHGVWLLPSAPSRISDFLYRPLFAEMEPNSAFGLQGASLVPLRLR